MIASPNASECIQTFEQCILRAYQDGGGVWTIGWGDTDSVHVGQVITRAEADERLAKRVVFLSRVITHTLVHPITQWQFDAFVSFAYNAGFPAFRGSTMLAKFNAGQDCSAEFMRWTLDNGKVVAGLGIRRAAERQLFRNRDWRAVA